MPEAGFEEDSSWFFGAVVLSKSPLDPHLFCLFFSRSEFPYPFETNLSKVFFSPRPMERRVA